MKIHKKCHTCNGFGYREPNLTNDFFLKKILSLISRAKNSVVTSAFPCMFFSRYEQREQRASVSPSNGPLTPITLLPPTTKLGQGYVFTRVCDSVHGGGGCLSACWDITPPPGKADPSPARQTPRRSACWDIWSTSRRYASYWNAILVIRPLLDIKLLRLGDLKKKEENTQVQLYEFGNASGAK